MSTGEKLDATVESLVGHLQSVRSEVSQEKGAFTLFAVFDREDMNDRWDLVVSAPWLTPGREGILTMTRALSKHLETRERVMVARVVPLPPESAFVQDLPRAVINRTEVSDGVFEVTVRPRWLGETGIERGYILESRRSESPARAVGVA